MSPEEDQKKANVVPTPANAPAQPSLATPPQSQPAPEQPLRPMPVHAPAPAPTLAPQPQPQPQVPAQAPVPFIPVTETPTKAPVQPQVTPAQKLKVKLKAKKKAKKPLKPLTKPEKEKSRFKEYRYRTRIIKGSILPILYGILSIQLLNKYVYEFPNYFEYKMMLILFGFLLGLGIMSGITIANLIRAKKKPVKSTDYYLGVDLNIKTGVLVVVPFLAIVIILAFFYSISEAWQFSTGFFLAAFFPFMIVILYEVVSKGKFFIREIQEGAAIKTRLAFVPS